MNVLIRADAGVSLGIGHVMRCLTLAEVLVALGAQVSFACRMLPGHQVARITDAGHQVVALAADAQDDIAALHDALPEQAWFDWIIVDHYGLDHHWQTASRRWAPRIAAVDDLATRRYSVDLLLNQNLSGLSDNYTPLLPEGCRTLLGPRYAMLREEFDCPAIDIKPEARRVLVNFGGFDAAMQTHHAMLALADFTELEVDFVAGVDNPAWAQMQALAQTRPNWRLHSFVSDFHQRMTEADLFIGAGGGTSWERAALGLPTICIAVSNNQQVNGEVMAAAGAHVFMGAREQVSVTQLRDAIGFVAANFYLRQSLAERSRQMVDGRGALRVAAALADGVLKSSHATLDDAQLLPDGLNSSLNKREHRS